MFRCASSKSALQKRLDLERCVCQEVRNYEQALAQDLADMDRPRPLLPLTGRSPATVMEFGQPWSQRD